MRLEREGGDWEREREGETGRGGDWGVGERNWERDWRKREIC